MTKDKNYCLNLELKAMYPNLIVYIELLSSISFMND